MKNEIVFGTIGTVVILAVILFYIVQFSNKQTANMKQPSLQNNAKIVTTQEVASHNSEKSCWIVVQNKAYDATPYLQEHPGGAERIVRYCGGDATKAFLTQDGEGTHSQDAVNLLASLYVGNVQN